MDVLLMTLIAGPLLASVALPATTRFLARPPRRDGRLVIPLAVASLAALGLLALLPWAGSDLALSIQWLPGTGRMVIGLGATGLYAALATTGGCALALWGARARGSSWMGALTLLAIAAAQVAFLAEHFLARYVALEIAALCVALAPLVDLWPAVGRPADDGRAAGGLARLVYLVLRLGDVGLLVAILALWSAGGTLDIAPALEAGRALEPARLNWIVGGFVLAVWIKVGGWPVHLWQQAGKRLSLFSHTWLYATLMPNLGLYLLYRVTPLLVQSGPMQRVAYGAGGAGAALAAILLTDTRRNPRSALVYLGAALGGLALVLAAAGLKTAVWITALALTPLRLLLYLAGDLAPAGPSPTHPGRTHPGHVAVVGLYALGGLALTVYCLLCAWWTRRAGAPPGALLAIEFAVALIGIWAARSAWLLWRRVRFTSEASCASLRAPVSGAVALQAGELHPREAPLVSPENALETRAASIRPNTETPPWRLPVSPQDAFQGLPTARRTPALAILGAIVLAGLLFPGPLARRLAAVAHDSLLPLPSALALARYLVATPAFWMALIGAAAARRLRRRPRRTSPDGLESQALDLEEGLAQAAQILSAVVEVGIQERILGGIVRAVLGGARATRRVIEQQILEGATQWVSQATIGGGRLAYRVLEQEGLEGLLRGIVRGVRAGGRWMQRWHTGWLRRNLLWVAASLVLAVLALTLYGW